MYFEIVEKWEKDQFVVEKCALKNNTTRNE